MSLRMLMIAFAASLSACVTAGATGAQDEGAASGGPECRMGADGRQACGYHCTMGADGQMACANAPDGVCAMGADGHVVCSQSAAPAAYGPRPECKLNSNGSQTCGYNCHFGSNGRWYCASQPNGTCAFNANGTWTCS